MRDDIDRPQPRPSTGRGKVVIRDAWNVETAGSIPAAQTNIPKGFVPKGFLTDAEMLTDEDVWAIVATRTAR